MVNNALEIRIRLSIEDTVHCGEEGGSIRLEGGCEVFAIEAQFRGMRGDLLEAGAAFLHQVQLGEDIGNFVFADYGYKNEDFFYLYELRTGAGSNMKQGIRNNMTNCGIINIRTTPKRLSQH